MHSCIKLTLFHLLPSPCLSFLTRYWAINSCFWSLCEAFCYHPNIWFSNKPFHAFLHPAFPVASASLLHFIFCVRTDIRLQKNLMPLSSLHSPMYHLYWFLLRWKAHWTESAFCSVLMQCLAQYSLAHIPDTAYGIIMCKITCCMYVSCN